MRLLLAALAIAAVAASAAAAPQPSWQNVPSATLHSQALVWASGRLWFVKGLDNGGFQLISGRRQGGRLVDWKTAKPALADGWNYLGQLGSKIVFAGSARADAQVVAFLLLPTGQVGPAGAVGGAPTPPSSGGSEILQLPDRAVRFVAIDTSREFVTAIGACCAADGSVATYTSFIKPGARPRGLLGLDRRGRLWLAWYTTLPQRRGEAGIVELDPVTLQPRGEKSMAPGLARGFVSIHALVCTDACRLLVSGLASGGFVDLFWGPAEGATRLRPPGGCRSPCSIDAREDRGRLLLAHLGGTGAITLARGDARGRNLRTVSAVVRPTQLGGAPLSTIPFGAFGPGVYATVAAYTGARTTVRVALLPSS